MQTSTPRSPRFDLPPAPVYTTSNTADNGLAEWTSKIKAMQRQVNADDEAEQRRLEEEIVRARLARMRRSTSGMSGDFGLQESSSSVTPSPNDLPAGNTTSAPASEKPPRTIPSHKPAVSSNTTPKRVHMSLAAFMGGSTAAGPRLKRHEPQQDATVVHDGRKDHGPVHPIFGRNGIAMPGMVKGDAQPSAAATFPPSAGTPVRAFPTSTPDVVRSRTTSTSSVARRYVEQLESQPQSLNPGLARPGIRERRISTPAGNISAQLRVDTPHSPSYRLSQNYGTRAAVVPPSSLVDSRSKTPITAEMRPKTPVTETRVKTPNPESPNRAKTPDADSGRTKSPIYTRSNSSQPSWTPRQQSTPIPSVTPTSPVRQTYSPQPSRGVSPAFLCPPANSSTKDPTPSISRLQGRGFVQSVVQASGRLESAAGAARRESTFGSPSQAASETRDKSARRASVLDRWQPAMNNTGTPSLPPQSPFPVNRGRTPEARQAEVKTHDTEFSSKSAVSIPTLPKTPSGKTSALPESANNNLGSSTTMIAYIKPTKTGDDPVVRNVDELGVKADGSEARTRVSSSPNKPLSHPTKDRAKKPRKTGGSAHVASPEGQPLDVKATLPQPIAVESITSTKNTQLLPIAPTQPMIRSRSKPQSQLPLTIAPSNTTGRVTDRWTEPTLIGVKPIASSNSTAGQPPPSQKPQGTVGRLALPGLAAAPETAEKVKEKPPLGKERAVSPSLAKHGRTPNTGNRATVMDVAQALSGAQQGNDCALSPLAPSILSSQAEKRKPSIEKYSSFMMPPLKEVKTPVSSPAGTLAKSFGEALLDSKLVGESSKSMFDVVHIGELSYIVLVITDSIILTDHTNESLPSVDVDALLKSVPPTFSADPNIHTISVETLSINNGTATPVLRDIHILYDTEVLVIVHRGKARDGGLVSMKVWCWHGKQCRFGEREQKKADELARRYGSALETVFQRHEPPELVHVLGGKIAIRQGTRTHWTSENTAMHVVRSSGEHIYIDELDLSIRNLCSGYSYCVSILDQIYVWHGCGSTPKERNAARDYAQVSAAKGTSIKELREGDNDVDDEMFWMVLGDSGDYAKADYWRFRNASAPSDPRCWIVDATVEGDPIRAVALISAETILQQSVYIIDCSLEFFVLVGKHARSKRSDISLAIQTVMAMAKKVAISKPFYPTIHVLVIPTQLPLDMRHAFRDLDESQVNGGFVPDHMNILSTTEAIEHLRTSSWEKAALRDQNMLPLGLDAAPVLSS
ncbi:uncharacterized protein F5891DRAFT_951765 [Suillus fuscotomentosus]|uniref:DUF7904 domain-containing protein n=1 Tax=Suillus fuscotomentosus TaxID=1912939 RepID=A0AAD4E6M3_9AGAM|nr:uncharacterized protein F5891DRAFT_951765 [Suillus fuscotomentosus]KAG1900621.1 hypothetical protein F5891DRAFT_951765 [Suillus fuscotomentosus]